METKICTLCGQNKPIDDFYYEAPWKGRRARKKSACKDCRRKVCKENYRTRVQNDPLAAYEQKLQQFGLTREQYLEKVEAQQNLCAICGKPETIVYRNAGRVKWLSVDHSHLTGQNRGLLCSKCNTALGLLDEDFARFQSAVDYLKKYSESV